MAELAFLKSQQHHCLRNIGSAFSIFVSMQLHVSFHSFTSKEDLMVLLSNIYQRIHDPSCGPRFQVKSRDWPESRVDLLL